MKISVIIPCYNEEEVLPFSYDRFLSVMEKSKYDYEFLFINDGSKDNTGSILAELADRNQNVKVMSFSRNFGHQCAVSAGISNCSGDVAVIIDVDLQDPPELIPDMIDLYLKEQCNVVYAVRKQRKGETFFKLFTASLFYKLLAKLSDVEIPRNTGDFRLIDRIVIDTYKALPERNKFIRGLISWMGFKQIPFYYEREERFAGSTKYPFRKMLKLASHGIFGFSKKPIKIATTLGIISIILAFLMMIWVLYLNIFIPERLVPGWASTIAIVLFMGGVQLFTIGILGEYIGSIFDETKKRPEYIIKEKLNFDR
ncbi:MAG: glycosyltransferase family 2 protein [Candidatus Azobacteroides sp.]|nr:glycosyltransferase family 2 protein [Candidatus Azobacteroides sp.]